MSARYLNMPAGKNVPDLLTAVIESPQGSRNGYRYDTEHDLFRLERVLASPLHYPAAHGFVPNTLGSNGKPVRIIVLMGEPTFVGCVVEVRSLGAIKLSNGGNDEELVIAVPVADRRYSHYLTLDSITPHVVEELKYFHTHYNSLEGLETEFVGWVRKEHAAEIIMNGISRFRKSTFVDESSS